MTDTHDLVTHIREQIETAWQADARNRDEARTDLRFLAGFQWTDEEIKARENRPTLTINRLPTFVRQVSNDIRQNPPSIKVFGVDDQADPETAKIYDGLIRAIEYRSSASHVYSTVAFHVASCGIGHFRIKTEYVDDAAFDQDILIDRIPDPLAVYWDPAAVKPDRSDGMWCAVLEQIPVGTFRTRYPGANEDSADVPDHQHESALLWCTDDYVLVAEYWRRVPVKKRLARIAGQTIDITGVNRARLEQRLVGSGMQIEAERDVDTHRVESYIASGTEILSGPHEWAGKYIPIVTAVGEEIPVGDQVVRAGIVRHARDPARLYNFWRSAAAESIGQAPKAPWILSKAMVMTKGLREMWETAHSTARAALFYDADPAHPHGPRRIDPPSPPAAMWQESQIAADDIKAVTGIHDASLGARGNETSGRAINARQRQGDTANYHIQDNLQESIEHAGRILIDLIPRIYDTERVVRILGEDDSERSVVLNQELGDGTKVNDLSVGRFDIRVSVGPSFSTRRAEAADSMLQFAQAVPGAAQLIGDIIAKNMDWPGADQIATRLKKALPPGMAEDGPESADPNAPPQAPPVDPMQQQADEAQSRSVQLDLEEKAEKVTNQKLVNAKLMAELEQLRSIIPGIAPGQHQEEMNGTGSVV